MDGLVGFAMSLVVPVVALVVALVVAKVVMGRQRTQEYRMRELANRLEVAEWALARSAQSARAAELQPAQVAEPRAVPSDERIASPTPTCATAGSPAEAVAAPCPTGAPDPPPAPRPRASVPAGDLEHHYGTRLVIWLGAAALALAGAFLVKYTFERDLIGPAARVGLGLAFGAGLVIVARALADRAAGVARGCAAAGVAVLFAALLAGIRLYGLIPPTLGFLGLLVTTGIAVLLSRRHGPIVAVVGMLGGFLTPLWIGSTEPRPWLLMGYLLLVQSGLLIAARRRGWWPVVGLTLVGSLGWSAYWVVEAAGLGGVRPAGIFLLVSTLNVLASLTRNRRLASAPAILAWAAAGLAAPVMAAVIARSGFGLIEWGLLGLLGVGCMVLAAGDRRYEGLPWFIALTGAVTVALWSPGPLQPPLRIWGVACGLLAIWIPGGFALLRRSSAPDHWAAFVGIMAGAYLLATRVALAGAPVPVDWGWQALLLSIGLGAMAARVARSRGRSARGDAALAVLVTAAVVLLGLAAWLGLEDAWIAIVWAIEIPLVAAVAGRLNLPRLHAAVWPFAAAVVARLGLAVLSTHPVEPLFAAHGLPLVAFVVGAVLLRLQGGARVADALECGAAWLGALWIALEVDRHLGLEIVSGRLGPWAIATSAWALCGLALLALERSSGRRLHGILGGGFVALGLGVGILAQGFTVNPYFRAIPVGETPIFNVLVPAYGLPAALGVIAARMLASRNRRRAAGFAGVLALLHGFLLVSLEVCQAFHGTILTTGPTTSGESYAYSMAWILFATGLLIVGILTRGAVVRYGSAAVMAVAVFKVFLVDTAHLADLYRVLSLFALGISLMLLAWLYQRFVFRDGTGSSGRSALRR